jgi:hypothetical protein
MDAESGQWAGSTFALSIQISRREPGERLFQNGYDIFDDPHCDADKHSGSSGHSKGSS